MAYQHYRSPFGDTTLTKVFVGGLAWETQTDQMRSYFEQFGDILEAVIITDKITGKSKGYGFVTYRDPESAKRACEDPNPMIDGRRANCNIASLGRPRPSPQGRNQGGNMTMGQGASSTSYSGAPPQLGPPPPPPPPPSVMYPPYGYATYAPDYSFQQAMYNPALQQPYYHHQVYGPTPAATVSTPYYYAPSPRGSFPPPPQAQRIQTPSYLYYPTPQMDPTTFHGYLTPPPLLLPTRHHFPSPSPTGSQTPQNTTSETEGGAVTTSESPNT